MTDRAVVVGLGVTGSAMARALTARGAPVVVVEDRPEEQHRALAAELGVELLEAPESQELEVAVAPAGVLLPSPGVPDHHPAFAVAAAAGVPVRSEFDLAREWDDRPLLAVTGTNGKTTVTTLLADMLQAGGVRSALAGNTDQPLVAAIDDPAPEAFVVEASSFRLGHTERWAPAIAAWLNFAPDHLDVHADLGRYEAAKARIWAHRPPGGVSLANADDPVVMRHAPTDAVTFSIREGSGADLVVQGGALRVHGELLADRDELWSPFPHTAANALAAAGAALAHGVSLDAARTALIDFTGLSHRVALVAEHDGVRWDDDSKSTTPHATAAALAGFDSVVLIAGGRNKGLDLGGLVADADGLRGVVAIGEASSEVQSAVAGRAPCPVASTMAEAVATAGSLARAGDAVLLSPGCASFDWYGSYAERGDDFASCVNAHLTPARDGALP